MAAFVPEGKAEAFVTVSAFLAHLEAEDPQIMYGSYTAGEAIEAFAHLMGVTASKVRDVGCLMAADLDDKPDDAKGT